MTQVAVELRQLQAGDAPALLAFYNGLSPATIRTFRPLRDKTTLAVCAEIVEVNQNNRGQRLDWVAWHANAIVGWGFVYKLDNAHPELGLGITDAFQGQGLGRALLDQLLPLVEQRTVATVYLIVVNDNQRAIQLYRSRGFVTYDEQFDDIDQLTYLYMKKELV